MTHSRNYKDLTGLHFGRLIVLARVENIESVHSIFTCRCVCGRIVDIRGGHLSSGKTQSCGCLRTKFLPGIAARNNLFYKYRREALMRNIEFTLDQALFIELTQQNCYYCDQIPATEFRVKTSLGVYIFNGLDRIDNQQGYHSNNVVTCCRACNYAKHTDSQEEYINRCIRVVAKWCNKNA